MYFSWHVPHLTAPFIRKWLSMVSAVLGFIFSCFSFYSTSFWSQYKPWDGSSVNFEIAFKLLKWQLRMYSIQAMRTPWNGFISNYQHNLFQRLKTNLSPRNLIHRKISLGTFVKNIWSSITIFQLLLYSMTLDWHPSKLHLVISASYSSLMDLSSDESFKTFRQLIGTCSPNLSKFVLVLVTWANLYYFCTTDKVQKQLIDLHFARIWSNLGFECLEIKFGLWMI